MALAITVREKWFDGQRLHIVGSIAATGNYASGGDTLSFASGEIKSQKIPDHVDVHGVAGFVYEFLDGTDNATGKLKVRGQEPTSATAGVIALSEIAAAAYPAGVTGDTIRFHAIFKSL